MTTYNYHVVVEARGKRYGANVQATNMRLAIDTATHQAWRDWNKEGIAKFEIECVWGERVNEARRDREHTVY